MKRELLAKVVAAIATAALVPDDERRVLLQLNAHGAHHTNPVKGS